MNTIEQILPTECGYACVAMLSGISLLEARQLVDKAKTKKRGSRTFPSDLRKALAIHSIKLGKEVYVESWSQIRKRLSLALLVVNYNESKNTWHWVVYNCTDSKFPIFDPMLKRPISIEEMVEKKKEIFSYYRISKTTL